MNILFLVPSYKPAYIYGGPIVVISRLAEFLAKAGHQVTVYTTTANGKLELDVIPGTQYKIDGVTVYYFKRNTKDHTHVSFSLWKALSKTAEKFDIIHIHSWWNFLVIGAVQICYRKKIRPILTPHGMFSTYILETNNSLPKKIVHAILGKKLLQHTVLHVSTQLELKESHLIIPDWENFIVSNLIELPEPDEIMKRHENKIFTIGFLSRIDPKKGLDILIRSLANVSFAYRLIVAGEGDPAYVNSLKQMSKDLGIEQHIQWVGWKDRQQKFLFYAGLDLFALTSHSENFAVVILESLVTGTPVLVSEHVGLAAYVKEQNAGWITALDISSVSEKLELAYHDHAKQQKIKQDAPALIRRDFDDIYLTEQYVQFYKKYMREPVH